MPEESLSPEALRLNFAAKGMSAKELVALSGAHTVRSQSLGAARYSHACMRVCAQPEDRPACMLRELTLSVACLCSWAARASESR